MNKVLLICAALAVSTSTTALAQSITNNAGQYGDVATVSGGYQLTSDPNGVGYGGIYFALSNFTLADLAQLSATYTLNQGSLSGGAPRFSLFDTTSNAANGAYIYFTDPNSTTLDLNNTIVECNGFGGCAYNYPGISYSSFLSQYGGTGLAYVTLDVDAGYSSPQQLTVSNFSLNGTNFGAPVPEPATWAMMLIGFGGIGFAMRRQRKAPQLPQAA
jgi:hypothetical protein